MRKKGGMLIVILISLIAVSSIIGFQIRRYVQVQNEVKYEEKSVEQEREKQERITISYERVNRAFGIVRSTFPVLIGEYTPLREPSEYSGIRGHMYLLLRFYENRTGIILSYEKVIEYFSEEYELDGTLRLYNNGKHPEIEAYVNWMLDNHISDFTNFFNNIQGIWGEYVTEHRNRYQQEDLEIFRFRRPSNLSREMIAALARKEADPDYELNLIGLQKQGYGILVENPHWEMD